MTFTSKDFLDSHGQPASPETSAKIANEKVDGLIDALKFYSLKSNYSVIDEGRNYSVNNVMYELDEDTYNDMDLGTRARAALEKIKGGL